MASVNKVIIIGNLGQHPELRQTQSGMGVASLSLATSRKVKAQDGTVSTETEWHRVVLFGRTAEIAKDYLRKGSPAYIEGRLRTRKWTDQQGVDRWITEIVGETLQLLGRREDGQGQGGYQTSAPAPQQRAAQPAPAPEQFDDCPF